MANLKLLDTPVESYRINGNEVFIKREDLACPSPAPPFAKVRGLLPTLISLKKQGYTTFGYMENSISMATWGIGYFCKQLDLKCVVFAPQYVDGLQDNQARMLEKWKEFDVEVRWMKACRQTIGYYMARKILNKEYQNAYMLPLGLSFSITVDEVAKQVGLLESRFLYGSIVVSVGSGIMIAGICKGIANINGSPDIFGILAAPKSEARMYHKIYKYSGVSLNEPTLFNSHNINLSLQDTRIGYKEIPDVEAPFPCNDNYDLKAWKWLLDNMFYLRQPLLFWNIGASYK